MKALCIDTQGEESIQRLSIINIEDIDISSVSRFGKEINISDPENEDLLLDQKEILAKVRQLDIVVDNYCHGMYILLND